MLQERHAPITSDSPAAVAPQHDPHLADLPRGLRIHLAVYALVNALLVLTWVVIEIAGLQDEVRVSVFGSPLPEHFPWPVFSIVVWGAFVVASVRRAQRGAPHVAPPPEELVTTSSVVPPTGAAGAVGRARPAASHPMSPRRALLVHAAVYVAVNAVVVAGWAVGGGFFWPVIPLVGWGVGLAMHVHKVFGNPPPAR